MSNKKFDLFKRLEELPSLVYMLLGVVCLVVHVLLCTYTEISVSVCGLVLLLIYILAVLVIRIAVNKKINLYRLAADASDEQTNGVITTFRNSLKIPYAVISENGKIITVNTAMRNIAGVKATMYNADISDICNAPLEHIIKSVSSAEDTDEYAESEDIDILKDKKLLCEISDRVYHINSHVLHSKGKLFYLLIFNDVTELQTLSMAHRALHTAIAYISIDNVDEIAQYARDVYQTEVAQVGNLLKDWAHSLGAILREYDRNKYILVLNRRALLNCVNNKFEILDKIRDIRVDDGNTPITISMGVTTLGATLAEREREALVCLELALQRGGDQAVLKNEKDTFYFGGRTKSQQKRSGTHSRIYAGRLCSMIQSASNVLVMGHNNPDFDSIGACVGIAAMCMHLGTKVKIVTNLNSDNFKACTSRLCVLSNYKDIFIDAVEGLDKIEFGTLLVIVDSNNFKILEAPEIANNCFKTAVIDHHIKKEEFENEPQLVYIDPSASSACELISEMLEFSIPVGTLQKDEANVILSGIMVDTQNFTRTVGTRTFAAALYLRSAGASTEQARTFFEQAFEDYHSEATFGTNAQIYNEEIAVTESEGTGSPTDRVSVAKAADRLLAVRNVNAAFALVKMGDVVHISGRSNGKINVQLILEKVGGGGHFDVAGAAIDGELAAAKQQLMSAIDEYYNDIYNEARE